MIFAKFKCETHHILRDFVARQFFSLLRQEFVRHDPGYFSTNEDVSDKVHSLLALLRRAKVHQVRDLTAQAGTSLTKKKEKKKEPLNI